MRNEVEMMRVLRLPPMGKLVVEASDQRYETLAMINNDSVRQRVLAAIGELIIFAGGYKTLVDAGVAPPLGAVEAPPAPATPPETADEALRKRQEAFLNSLEQQFKAAEPVVKPTVRSIIPRAPLANKPITPAPEPKATLAEQIDAILQKYVQADASLSKRSIHLHSAPAGGLQIEVDGRRFERPTEIEDRQVQLVIKMALKEWENQ